MDLKMTDTRFTVTLPDDAPITRDEWERSMREWETKHELAVDDMPWGE